jgi:hypothetical protein
MTFPNARPTAAGPRAAGPSALNAAEDLDGATVETPLARRTYLVALWAGRRLGLSGPALAAYAASVMEADRVEPGDEDLIERLRTDFEAAGLGVDVREIRVETQAAGALAYRQILAAD